MGVVYEAEDTQRGERVAVKTLHALSADGIYNLKREFRVVQDVAHPNVVALHDLIVADDACIFTMDLVQGVHFLEHVRPGHLDEERLRAALPQLVLGLRTLHKAGTIHRDIKPANVLVDETGRVVLVDFGLAVPKDRLEPVSSDYIVGTAPYMAPELIAADRATPATDWYSMGAILYEALTGARPYSGAPLAILTEKQAVDPPAPSTIADSVPPDLEALCLALMHRDPDTRPDGDDVLRILGVERRAKTSPALAQPALFVGRDAELDVLDRSIVTTDVCARAVVIVGESGIGKSSLVRTALDRVPAENLVVLHGRCIENELVPYKAMDSLIDGLSAHWAAMDTEDARHLLPAEPGFLRKLFPVLGRVPAMLNITETPRPGLPLNEVRTRGFAALRETLRSFAQLAPVVLFLDDMQWVDNDTMTLMADLLRPPAPPAVCVLLSARPAGASAIEDLVARSGIDARRLSLGPLSFESARRASRELLGDAVPDLADQIARESGGSPFFLGELALHARATGSSSAQGLSLDTVLSQRIGRLDGATHAVLELLAVAREPISHRVLKFASQNTGGDLARIERTLQRENFARSSGARIDDRVETYHDRIREVVYEGVSRARRQELHRRLAVELERFEEGTPERLARHWRGAGVPARAAENARRAADKALATLECDRAARLYGMTLDLGTHSVEERVELLVARATAFAQAGRSAEAAADYLSAVDIAPGSRRTDLRRRAAHELMAGGYLPEGLEVIRPVLNEFGVRIPATARSSVVSLLTRRAYLRLRGYRWRRRRPEQLDQRSLEKVDLLRAVATGCNLSDYIRGADFQARHVVEALRCGDPDRIAHALGFEAAHLAAVGNKRRAMHVASLCKALADEHDTGHTRAFVHWSSAIVSYYCDNAWQRSLDELRLTQSDFHSERNAGWELDMVHAFAAFSLLYLGDLRELSELVPSLIESAMRRGARYDAVNMRTRANIVWLAQDDTTTAEAQLEHALRSEMPTSERFLAQHFFAIHGSAELALYRGDARAARRVIDADLARAQKSLVLKIRLVRIELVHLRGRVAVALAAQTSGSEREGLLRECRGLVRELRRAPDPIAGCFAQVLSASIERVAGDREAAAESLSRAAANLDELDTALIAAACRVQLGDPAGEAELRERGVRAPRRLAGLLVPGW
jgi:hypothetical protein